MIDILIDDRLTISYMLQIGYVYATSPLNSYFRYTQGIYQWSKQ
jgi:hypothetical protein